MANHPLSAIYDQHLHTWHSVDSDAAPKLNVRRAIELGLGGLIFTDHFDSHPTERERCLYDYDAIAADVTSLRERFGDQIYIGHGIEVCYQPQETERILAAITDRPFDLVILSVHWVGDRALHQREHWEGVDSESATQSYFRAVLEALRWAGDLGDQNGGRLFDVFGHLDVVKRYMGLYFDAPEIRPDPALLDDVLNACMAADIVPEINLSPLRRGLGEGMPSQWIVQKYAEMGGKTMSLGSDAHKSHDVGGHMEEGVEMLRRSGIANVSVFRNRRRNEVPVDRR